MTFGARQGLAAGAARGLGQMEKSSKKDCASLFLMSKNLLTGSKDNEGNYIWERPLSTVLTTTGCPDVTQKDHW